MPNRKKQSPGVVRLAKKEDKNKRAHSAAESRSMTIAVRVSPSQSERIKSLARQCGMTRSSYMLARAYNYQPRERLTNEDRRLLESLVGARTDIQNYSNALRAMSEQDRIQLFRNYTYMLEWMRELYLLKGRVESVLDRMKTANNIPNVVETDSQ